jgi:curved DNA-binding protein
MCRDSELRERPANIRHCSTALLVFHSINFCVSGSDTVPESTFVDYYEILESSPLAHPSSIEQLFVCLVKRFHPDVPGSGDKQKFLEISEAYKTLRTPASRKTYDIQYAKEKRHFTPAAADNGAAACELSSIEEDAANCQNLLALFYQKRREDISKPGLAIGGLEHRIEYPLKVLEFYLWYCTQKGWLNREEGGQLAITAAGIDKIGAKLD